MIAHKWEPITPLREDCGYDFSEIDSLQRQWLAYRHSREEVDPEAYAAFLVRLTRSWAIETGVIEGLYTLDRGTTETLVMRGISAELIEHSSTNKDPHELARILADHRDAVEGVYVEIREHRPISRSAIRQIHATLTRNQPTFRAMDQFGRWFDARLEHGEFKKLPNNPTRQDDTIHEYCPPEHVDSELDNLLEWYNQYLLETDRYHPLLTATWFHHRFTQIHPFQDGNGRVVRALLTWHLVREGYLPVVIQRDDRASYIDALESADRGKLVPFVDLLVRVQQRTILAALSEPETAEPIGAVDQILDHIIEQIGRTNAAVESPIRTSVNSVAEKLQAYASDLLKNQAAEIIVRLGQAGRNVVPFIVTGGPSEGENWYRSQVIQTANNSGHWANLNEVRFAVRLALIANQMPRQPRLVFVVSLHHTRRQLSGIMAATAFALIDHYTDHSSDRVAINESALFVDCTPLEPFIFTWESNPGALLPRFKIWTEQSLAIALRQWGEYLS